MSFSKEYSAPVVVAGPAFEAEIDPGVVEIANVTGQSFEIRFREWNYLDGLHDLETVSYLVVESGTTTLSNGGIVEAGTLDIDKSWTRLNFGVRRSSRPVVFGTVVDNQSLVTAAPRVQRWTDRYVEFMLRPEEANSSSPDVESKLNWIAWPTGQYGGDSLNFGWKAGFFRTDERAKTLNSPSHLSSPCLLADIVTPTSDPVTVRRLNQTISSNELRVVEEQSSDVEQQLGPETIAYLAADCGNSKVVQFPVDVGISTNIATNSATLSWPQPTGVGQLSFTVTDQAQGISTSTSGNSVELLNLSKGVSYEFTVIATDSQGNQSAPLPIAFSTLQPDFTAPVFTAGNVLATEISETTATLHWPPAIDESSVRYRLFDTVDTVLLETEATSAVLTGLVPGTVQNYKLIALDESGNESSALNVTFTTVAIDEVAPEFALGDLLASEVTETTATLTWPVAGDESTVQYRLTDSADNIVQQSAATTASLTELPAGTEQNYSVLAFDESGNESSALMVTFTTIAIDETAPVFSAGDIQVSEVTETTATITWPVASDESTVQYKLTDSADDVVQQSEATTASLTELPAGTDQTYSVLAFDESGNESSLLTVTFTTIAIDETAPVFAVGDMQASDVTETTATITWPVASDESTVQYKLTDSADNVVQQSEATTASLMELPAGTEQTYSVLAFDGSGNESSALMVTFTTIAIDETAPVFAAGDIQASGVTETTATLTWPVASDESTVQYRLTDSADNIVQQSEATTASLTELPTGTEQTYSVLAFDGAGNESSALMVTFTTIAIDETAPVFSAGDIQVSDVTETTATLIWPVASDESTVQYRLTDSADNIVQQSEATTASLTELPTGTEQTYSVLAFDGAGNESSALMVTFTTIAIDETAPVFSAGDIQVSDVTETTATLIWPVASDESTVQYRLKDSADNIVQQSAESTASLMELPAGTEQTYSVLAFDESGNESSALMVTFTTIAIDETAPVFSAGDLQVSDVTETTATLTWPVASDESTVQYRLTDSAGNVVQQSEATTASLTALSAGLEQTYAVLAFDESGNESLVLTITFTTISPDVVAPVFSAGTLLVSDITETSALLMWPPATDEGMFSYFLIDNVGSVLVELSDTSASVEDLLAGTEYSYSVVAEDIYKNRSDPLSVTFVTQGAVTSPTFASGEVIIINLADTQVTVEWPLAIGQSAITYVLTNEDGNELLTTESNSAVITGLQPDTDFTVEIVAVDEQLIFSEPLTVTFRTLSSSSFVAAPGDLFVSMTASGTVANLTFAPEDVLRYNKFSRTWSLLFDGSDVGVTKDVDAFTILPGGGLLLSFDTATTLADVGTVDDSDIVLFSQSSLGGNTEGQFSMYLDGSDVGLTAAGEDIDSLTMTENGELVIGISGRFNVSGLIAEDEDLVLFSADSYGADTAGTWQLYFDGSEAGLAAEDIWGASLDDSNVYFVSQSGFSIDGVNADPDDVITYRLNADEFSDAPALSTYFDGDFHDSSVFRLDALDLGPVDQNLVVGDFDFVEGIDWSMPHSAVRSENSGITWIVEQPDAVPDNANRLASDVFGVETDEYVNNRFAVMVRVVWKDVNPAPGVFDWSSVDDIIDEIDLNGAPGVGIFLWPRPYGENIPQWVNDTLGFDFSNDPANVFQQKDASGNYVFNTPLKLFIDELVSHFSANNRIVHIDARSAFDNDNGEWVFRGPDLTEADTLAIASWTRAHHQIWQDAAQLNNFPIGKIVSIIAWPLFHASELLEEAFLAGMGQRDGQPSRRQIWYEAYGSFIDEAGYLVVDETSPAITNDAIRYSELTEFTYKGTSFGPLITVNERLKAGLLWNLHSRRNWLAVPAQLHNEKTSSFYTSMGTEMKSLFDAGQNMIRWAQYEIGHTMSTANDAWSWTKSLTYRGYNNNVPVGTVTVAKNVERWLHQRDVAPDGITYPVEQTRKSEMFQRVTSGIICDSVWCEDYKARATKQLAGHNAMYFSVEPGFMNTPHAVQLKVSFYDYTGGEWRLEYTDGGGQLNVLDTVEMTGTGAVRTVTFELPEFSPAGQFADGMDFKIRAVGSGDAVIRFTRLIKLNSDQQ